LSVEATEEPPPPPPPPPPEPEPGQEAAPPRQEDFRQKGKVFVGNLPLWARKPEIAEFFRQFGPLEKVELVRGHDDPERNVGFCFLYYGGDDPEAAAERAVEVDGAEFRGKSLTVRLDDGRKGRARAEERARWVEGGERRREPRSPWHKGRDDACRDFRRVLESRPEDWQAVVSAFERIPKVIPRIMYSVITTRALLFPVAVGFHFKLFQGVLPGVCLILISSHELIAKPTITNLIRQPPAVTNSSTHQWIIPLFKNPYSSAKPFFVPQCTL
jgi:RNA recognition motif-containing protein